MASASLTVSARRVRNAIRGFLGKSRQAKRVRNAIRRFLGKSRQTLRLSPRIRDRTDLLNYLAASRKSRRYLEIGVRDPLTHFDLVRVPTKHSVDPAPRGPVDFEMTSDEFFASLDPDAERYDLVFIDGLHLAEQTMKDVENALRWLSPQGVIVVHDCNPLTEEAQSESYDGVACWNGTVWKAWVALRGSRTDLRMVVVDIDHGCGVIQRGSQHSIPLPERPEFSFLELDRQRVLGLVSVREFLEGK
jgi:hypothetical protein